MPGEMNHDEKQLGRKFDGSYRLTFSLILGLVVLIIGVLLTIYLGGVYSFVFGVPLVIIGLLIPILLQFVLAEKRD